MIVKELMNDNPGVIRPNSTLEEALNLMAPHKKRHLVVIDKRTDSIGILSDRDLAFFYDPVNMTQERWRQGQVSDLMTQNPHTIGSGAPLEQAAKLLIKEAISALPVVDNGELVGIITDRDFVRYFSREP